MFKKPGLKYGVYHWGSLPDRGFMTEALKTASKRLGSIKRDVVLMGEFDTFDEAIEYVTKEYGPGSGRNGQRVRPVGSDRVQILYYGYMVAEFSVG